MLIIKVNSNNNWQQIDLTGVTSISLQYNSPMLQFDGILGDFSLPFTLIKTITNNKIFEFPHKLSNNNQSVRQYQAQLIVNGIVLHTGIISVKETTDDTLKANLKLNYSEYSELFNNTKITGDFYGGDKDWVWKSEYKDTDGDDFALPQIYNDIYFENSKDDSSAITINEYVTSLDKYRAENFVVLQGEAPRPFPICPQPYLYKIINNLFSALGINVLDNFFENDIYLKMLLLYNNNNIILFEKTSETNPFYLYLQKYNLKTCLPDKKISELITGLKNYFCIDFNVKNNELKIIPIQDYLLSSNYIDITDKAIEGIEKSTQNIQNIQINLNFGNDAAPIKTDIIKNLSARFEDVGGNLNNFPAPPPELGDVAMIHDYTGLFMEFFKYDFNKFGVKAFTEMNTGARFHPYFQKKNSAIETTSINSKAGFIATSDIGMANVKLQGNTNLHSEITSFELKLMIYKSIGTLPPHYAVTVPTATNFLVDAEITPNYVGLSLDFWGVNSVRRKYWDTFINWFGNIPYKLTRKIDFSLIDIKDFDFTKKYKIDNQLFFIENIKLSIDVQGNLKPATCVLVPID